MINKRKEKYRHEFFKYTLNNNLGQLNRIFFCHKKTYRILIKTDLPNKKNKKTLTFKTIFSNRVLDNRIFPLHSRVYLITRKFRIFLLVFQGAPPMVTVQGR